ncbi:MAG: barstar family protein [Chloroflexota bacterium]
MKTLEQIIIDNQPVSGVYWVGEIFPEDELKNLDVKLSPKTYHIKGSQIHTSQEFLNTARAAMDAPEPCTYNWDMFGDCMRGIDHPSAPNKNHIFIYDAIEVFAKSSPLDFQISIQIMIDSTGAWRERLSQKRMYALLLGDKIVLQSLANTYSWLGKEIVNDFWLLFNIMSHQAGNS